MSKDKDEKAGKKEDDEPTEEEKPKPAKKLDETVPGGRYVNTEGVTVNAEGEPIGKGKGKKAEDDDDEDDKTAKTGGPPKRT